MAIDEQERLRRWRLMLGKAAEEGLGMKMAGGDGEEQEDADGGSIDLSRLLSGDDLGMDSVLEALYDADKSAGGMGKSSPRVARWLGDIRTYFPSSTVRVMQQD